MNTIFSYKDLKHVKDELFTFAENIVLVGGCFDLLHIGHIQFLQNARTHGSKLVILLESDTAIRHKKGINRPINCQKDRAFILAELRSVDIIILMPEQTKDTDYYEVTKIVKPAIIATTVGDSHRHEKELCADIVHAKVVDVVSNIKNKSTSHLAKILQQELL